MNQSKDPAKYLESLGLKSFRDGERFGSFIKKNHGEAACIELDRAWGYAESDPERFYDFIHQDYRKNLDIASQRRNLYFKFLEHFVSIVPSFDGLLLDVGCGNGLLTCFYALKHPNSKVIGIDKSEKALQCARQLADFLKTENTEFLQADCNQPDWPIREGSVDLAISVTGFTPLSSKRLSDLGLLEWAESIRSDATAVSINNLAKFMKPDGCLISVDRLPNAEDQLLWLQSLQNGGFRPDLEASADISFVDLGVAETLPVLVCHLGGDMQTPVELLSFVVDKRGGIETLGSKFKNEALTELMFASFSDKHLKAAWDVTYRDGSGTQHYEIWQSGIFVLIYVWSSLGQRDLSFRAAYQLLEIIKDIETQLEMLRHHTTIERRAV